MKIYSIIVYQKKDNILVISNSAYDINDISFFKRGTVKEFLNFFSKTVAENMHNQRLCITEKEYLIHSSNNDDVTVVIISDKEYPYRVIYSLSDIIFQEKKTGNLNLDQMIKKYQNPSEIDSIIKIQKNIEATKIVMMDNIDKVLTRGEKIDDLIVKSDELSQASIKFYTQADKMNSCCVIC